MNYFYKKLILPLFTVLLLCNSFTATAQITKDYDLWLQYQKSSVANDIFKSIALNTKDETDKAIQNELKTASERMFQYSPTFSNSGNATLIIKKTSELEPSQKNIIDKANALNEEGFAIETIQNKGRKTVIITAKTSLGLLYGTFRLLRELQINASKKDFSIVDEPKLKVRMLNHWDNLDGTVERGYAGSSI